MEMNILYWLQGIRTPMLDQVMLFFSNIAEYGAVWLVFALAFLISKKYRAYGNMMFLSAFACLLIGELGIKFIVCRARPFTYDATVEMVKGMALPISYAFPSGHTMQSFSAATMLVCCFKKKAIPAVFLAALIGISRMYLFVHFPTDVLGGAVLGSLVAIYIFGKREKIAKKLRCEIPVSE